MSIFYIHSYILDCLFDTITDQVYSYTSDGSIYHKNRSVANFQFLKQFQRHVQKLSLLSVACNRAADTIQFTL